MQLITFETILSQKVLKNTLKRQNVQTSEYIISMSMLILGLIFLWVLFAVFKKFFETQLQLKSMEPKPELKSDQKVLKLQAYERLLLFCERVSLPTLLLRIASGSISAKGLHSALIMAIQQEYEHNVTQQLYISDQLWEIIKLAKNQMIEIISQAKDGLGTEASGTDLSNELMDFVTKQNMTPIDTAKMAIKKEAGLIL